MSSAPRKVVVFGIDGGTLSLAAPWAQQGELPHLARLMREGTAGVLRSTVHPLTPQAWCSFLTGMNPGKHGVFDFGHRRSGSYELGLADARSRRAPAVWSHLEAYGRTTGMVNLPMTFPLEPVHGFQVAGMHTPTLEQAVGPAALLEEIREVCPDYQIDAMSPWYADLGPFVADVHRMADARGRLAAHLYRTRRPDLFMVVMVAVDRICHALYGQMQHPYRPEQSARGDWKYGAEVLRAYQAVDRALGELLEHVDDETVVIVMSDHGFGALERDVSLNQHLLDQGLMSFCPRKVRPRLAVAGGPPGGPGGGRTGSTLGRLADLVPALRRWSDRAIRRGRIPGELRRWEYVDWSRTVAYSHGFFGNVYVNLRGREPEGCVEPADYDRVRDSVAEALGRLRDPDDGGRIVDHVYRREELYHGPFLEEAPDLVVVMRDYAYITRGGSELTATEVVAAPSVRHTGNHRLDGMVVLWGPGVRAGGKVHGGHIVDIMPTVLQIMGVPVPEDVDGRVLGEALERPEQLASVARRLGRVVRGDRRMTAAEERLIRQRLKSLGYLE